jgi:hypothetical protein
MKKHVFWMEFESICCNTLIWKLRKIIDVSVFEILLDFIVVETHKSIEDFPKETHKSIEDFSHSHQ